MATIKTKYEFAGTGCLVQGIGLVLLFFFPLGTIAGIGLFFYGSLLSKRMYCSTCGNRIEHKGVTICPTCKADMGIL